MKIIELIKQKSFEKALQILNDVGLDNIKDHIIEAAYESDDVAFCEFYDFLLTEVSPDSADYYYAAAELYTTVFNYLPEGYSKAFKFSKKAIEIDPSNVSLKEFILLFYSLPDQLLNKELAVKYAKDVIEQDKENKAAKLILENA